VTSIIETVTVGRQMRLCRAVQLLRAVEGLTVRTAAEQIGISAPTLSRFENGKPVDLANFVKLLNWLTK
jgi:transcriptional regulator with XRE-family HTH domain